MRGKHSQSQSQSHLHQCRQVRQLLLLQPLHTIHSSAMQSKWAITNCCCFPLSFCLLLLSPPVPPALLPVRRTATAATCGSEVGSGTRRGKWKNFRTYYIYFSITFFFLSDFYSVTFFISLSFFFLILFVLFSRKVCATFAFLLCSAARCIQFVLATAWHKFY